VFFTGRLLICSPETFASFAVVNQKRLGAKVEDHAFPFRSTKDLSDLILRELHTLLVWPFAQALKTLHLFSQATHPVMPTFLLSAGESLTRRPIPQASSPYHPPTPSCIIHWYTNQGSFHTLRTVVTIFECNQR